MTKNPKFFPWLAFAAVAFFWGTTFLGISIGVKTLPPLFMAACRHTIAGFILLTYFLFKGYKLPEWKSMKSYGINGILMLAGGNGIISWGMQYVGSGLTALICALTPVYIVLINKILGDKEKLHPFAILGFVICIAGQFFLFKDKIKLFENDLYFWGIMAVLLSNFLWALGTVYSKNHKTDAHPLFASAMQMIPGGFLLFMVSFLRGEIHDLHPAPEAIYALTYLIVFGSIIAYGSYMYILKQLPATIVSTYAYINTIVAIFLGWIVLHEELDFTTIVSVILTLIGVFLVSQNAAKSH